MIWNPELCCESNNKPYSNITPSFTNKKYVKECIDQRSVKSHNVKLSIIYTRFSLGYYSLPPIIDICNLTE